MWPLRARTICTPLGSRSSFFLRPTMVCLIRCSDIRVNRHCYSFTPTAQVLLHCLPLPPRHVSADLEFRDRKLTALDHCVPGLGRYAQFGCTNFPRNVCRRSRREVEVSLGCRHGVIGNRPSWLLLTGRVFLPV